ncbi:type I-D CRISPR-associated protein Cas7/Csc2 [Thermus scotoductus]|uniref:Type I-D CRISPR-associated protein Cas7/Csc2 n=1 Tax=Thermus scotoductus TaxID=37636 RepID=A0A430UYW3_THESC|nr:type I-D CRISPR-associated protein Cas7/Csc2 [Thermus scotoductus]RTH98275.1 type I-D CRISPR-associated protein Cas7/Csc2 [Thermus scotoductus]RTI14725.1 type I-D CRISPR-associated protein Cas7/Csc2 [Thermus scotoductus]
MFAAYRKHFQEAIPQVPGGKYAHFVVLRKTDSYAVFKTDGELNVARVQAGLKNANRVTRPIIFKRKQTTPERLVGRELLRHYGIYEVIQQEHNLECKYNEAPCGVCPDCVIYGYAIGDSGSEKSKVYIDTAYALTPYEVSHQTFTLNAPYEDGTMTRGTTTTNRFSEQDHVIPEVYFPSVVTLRDPTPNTFLYVLNNLLRTKRYGAQTTRTGQVHNEIVAVVFADGEIFSNLRLTQKMYDLLADVDPPYPHEVVREKSEKAVEELMKDELVIHKLVMRDVLNELMKEAYTQLNQEETFKKWLQQLVDESLNYAKRVGVLGEKKEKGK